MEQRAIVHEWFYPGGPDTFEYLLPVESFSPEHSTVLPAWIMDYASLTPGEANRRFADYLDTIDQTALSDFTRVVETLAPFSVVVHQDVSWLLCKRTDQFGAISGHGNMLLLREPHKHVPWPSFFGSDKFDSLKRFLTHFGDARIDMPPTCGILSPVNLQPVTVDLRADAWKKLQHWAGSYPVYNIGNGEVVLVNSRCEFGIWGPGRGHSPNSTAAAVEPLGTFADFIQYAASETGIRLS